MIIIEKLNETFLKIRAEQSALNEIKDAFSYFTPNFQFDPRFKTTPWNGKKSLLDLRNNTFYCGLMPELAKWLDDNNYEYMLKGRFNAQNFSEIEALQFIETLGLPAHIKVRDYQLKYFIKSVRNQRAILLSPTASGKSLIIYLIFRYFNKKTLLIVPTVSLVSQMFDDFKEYGYNSEGNIHKVFSGQDKSTNKLLTISTWQSVYEQNRNYFENFRVVVGDEAHGFAATSLVKIMKLMTNTPVRVGLTGTLPPEELTNQTIKGLFGPVTQFVTTKQLQDQNILAPMTIKAIVLKHEECPYSGNVFKPPYQDEITYLVTDEGRNKFLMNLALSLKGNTFVMFRIIDHGKALYEEISKRSKIPVFYVDGQTPADEREEIRKQVENLKDSITICSSVFTTGINIKSINNIIFTHPHKGRVKILQSIGRGLRMKKGKLDLTLFDIADDICDNVRNYTLSHFKERLKIYKSEEFYVKFYKVDLKYKG